MKTVSDKIYKGQHNPYENLSLMTYDLQGWDSQNPAFEDSIKEIQPKLIVEVGTWKGGSAVHMAKTCLKYYDDFEIVCIDTFLASVEHWTNIDSNLPASRFKNGRPDIYEQFLSNVVHEGLQNYITPFPIDSINGALTLKSFGVTPDMVYIDAGHEYASVFMDLAHYKDILRSGGHLLGDDWFHPPIKKAVESALGSVITKNYQKFLWVKP